MPRPVEMVQYLFVRVLWDAHTVEFPLRLPMANIKEIHVTPEASHPFGRKGLVLASAWKQATEGRPDIAGMLILDGDVLIDPHDWFMMRQAIQLEPGAVQIGPSKLWPVSLDGLPGWAWGHCKNGNFTQDDTDDPDFFAFNFTYIPRKVIELAIAKGLKTKVFPGVDTFVSKTAREAKIPMRVVKDCYPKHMHY
jgi:hypothetical protein